MTAAVYGVALIGLLGAGPKVAVFEFQGIGVDSVTALVATSMFRTELGNTGRFTVATADEVAAVLGADKVVTKVADAQDAARRMDAAKAVIGSLSRLGTQTIGMVKLIDVAGGNVEFEDQLATTSRDELDIVLKRLAKAVATKEKASSNVELGEVTEKESREASRKQAFFGGGMALGGFMPLGGMGTSEMLPTYSGFALYETPDFFAEARLSASFGSLSSNYIPFTIGVFKTATRTDFTPYYGGAIGIGGRTPADRYHEGGTGFVLAPGAGYMLFHTYDFHIMADARYYMMFGGGDVAHGLALSINLAYRRGKGGGGGCCLLGL